MSQFVIDIKRIPWFDTEDQVKRETYRWDCPLCSHIMGYVVDDRIQAEVRPRVHMIVEHNTQYANLKVVISDTPSEPHPS